MNILYLDFTFGTTTTLCMYIPGGDPEPLEQLEFPMDENPDEDGLFVFLFVGALPEPRALVDLFTSDDDTDNEVLKWCLLPARTEMRRGYYH